MVLGMPVATRDALGDDEGDVAWRLHIYINTCFACSTSIPGICYMYISCTRCVYLVQMIHSTS